jgi:hypothetical protein
VITGKPFFLGFLISLFGQTRFSRWAWSVNERNFPVVSLDERRIFMIPLPVKPYSAEIIG